MPNFAILRLGKIRTQSALSNAGAHNHRTRPQANANPAFTPHNREFVASPLSLSERVNGRLDGLKFRKDAVLASELVLTASPDFFLDDTITDWLKLNLEWLRKHHGKNLVSCVLHLDEATPHLHAVIVPLCPDGKLAAKRYWGGPAELVALQTDYALAMKPLGLSRGIEGSNRPTNATVARWRGAQAMAEGSTPKKVVPQPMLPPPPPLPNRFSMAMLTAEEWAEMFVTYGKRCIRRATKSFEPVLKEFDCLVEQFTVQALLSKGPRPVGDKKRSKIPKNAFDFPPEIAPDDARSRSTGEDSRKRAIPVYKPRQSQGF